MQGQRAALPPNEARRVFALNVVLDKLDEGAVGLEQLHAESTAL